MPDQDVWREKCVREGAVVPSPSHRRLTIRPPYAARPPGFPCAPAENIRVLGVRRSRGARRVASVPSGRRDGSYSAVPRTGSPLGARQAVVRVRRGSFQPHASINRFHVRIGTDNVRQPVQSFFQIVARKAAPLWCQAQIGAHMVDPRPAGKTEEEQEMGKSAGEGEIFFKERSPSSSSRLFIPP